MLIVEGDDLTGEVRDGSADEIARLKAELPDDPTQLPLSRCAIEVNGETAATLSTAWRTMLTQVQSSREQPPGLDGITYRFSMQIGERQAIGEIWTPEPGTRTAQLAGVAEAMRDYCGNRREETLRELLAVARQLGRR